MEAVAGFATKLPPDVTRVQKWPATPTLSAGQTLPQQQSLERVWQSAVMLIDSKLASLPVHFMS